MFPNLPVLFVQIWIIDNDDGALLSLTNPDHKRPLIGIIPVRSGMLANKIMSLPSFVICCPLVDIFPGSNLFDI